MGGRESRRSKKYFLENFENTASLVLVTRIQSRINHLYSSLGQRIKVLTDLIFRIYTIYIYLITEDKLGIIISEIV